MFRFLLGHTHIWVAMAYGMITYMFTVIRHQLVRQLDNGAIRVRIRKMRNLCVRVPPCEVIQVRSLFASSSQLFPMSNTHKSVGYF